MIAQRDGDNLLIPKLLLLYSQNSNRMKRSSSSSAKENILRNCISKSSIRKPFPNHHHSTVLNPQTRIPAPIDSPHQTPNTCLDQFYKTFGSNNYLEWTRPESKQACRKLIGRPQTSKGIRPIDRTQKKWLRQAKEGAFHSQYVPEKILEENKDQGMTQIEIIVTKARKKPGMQERINRSKFQTDLDDEFLQLFAS